MKEKIEVTINQTMVRKYVIPERFTDRTVEIFDTRIDAILERRDEDLDTLLIEYSGKPFQTFSQLAQYINWLNS